MTLVIMDVVIQIVKINDLILNDQRSHQSSIDKVARSTDGA
jgi:hypothetical protein